MASIVKRGDSYKITVTSGRDAKGKQIRHYKTWKPDSGMTARQIEKELKKAAYEFERDIEYGYAVDDQRTFREYVEYYQTVQEQRGDKRQTIALTARRMKKLDPYIGHLKLCDIRPSHLNAIYRDMMKEGARKNAACAVAVEDLHELIPNIMEFSKKCDVQWSTIRCIRQKGRCTVENAKKIEVALNKKGVFRIEENKEPLRISSILTYHHFINSILAQATKEMIIPYNPAQKVELPRQKQKPRNKCIQPDTLERFMEALQGEPIRTRAMFTLYIITGCRRGEIAALKWSKVDLLRSRITIDAGLNYLPEFGVFEDETKTGNIREIALPVEVTRLLMEYRRWQDGERMKWGELWQNTDYVFTKQRGGAVQPNTINVQLRDFCKAHALPHITPHMFRHTAASILISRGIDVLTVSKMLGHARTSTTLDIYGHEIEEAKAQAIECIADEILRKKA